MTTIGFAMKFQVFALCAAMFFISSTPQAMAYDTLVEDFSLCTNGDSSQPEKIVSACTRLIENSQAENETTGTFYMMRAVSNTDRELNCRDSRKALTMITDLKLVTIIQDFIKTNC